MIYEGLETIDICDECTEETEIYMEGLCWDCYCDKEIEIKESNT